MDHEKDIRSINNNSPSKKARVLVLEELERPTNTCPGNHIGPEVTRISESITMDGRNSQG